MKNEKDIKLKQSNKLILATHKMNIQQLRLFFYVCSNYKGDLTVKIPIDDLYLTLAYQGGEQRQLLKKAIPSMMKSALIHIEDNNGERWSVAITDSYITKDEQEAHFTFNNSVKNELDEIRNYTWLYLSNLTGMSSTYAIRLYEFFAMRLGSQNMKEKFDYDINQLREYLDCSDKYPRFEAFERKVLNVAKEQINKKTNIQMSYKKMKTKQKITSIKFSFKWKSKEDIIDVKYTVHDENEFTTEEKVLNHSNSDINEVDQEALNILKQFD